MFSTALVAISLLALAGCAIGPTSNVSRADTPWDKASVLAAPIGGAPAWQHRSFPGKAPNQFSYLALDGRPAMAVQSTAAVSVFRKVVQIEPEHLTTLQFSWRKSGLIAGADMALRDKDDALRIVLAFDGDRSRLSAKDQIMSELALTLTGEEMPYATLMYVWCNQREVGTVVSNPRTDRIRKLVLESGRAGLGRWLDYERDIRADYRQVFGEEPGRLIAVGLMTDTDNTRSSALTWYGPLSFGLRAAVPVHKEAP